jgi:group I intron endonuclease
MKKTIIKENKDRSGIYMITNKLTGDFYIGQSTNLSNGSRKYFSISYLSSKKGLIVSRALLKYGYSNFFLTILEYCNNDVLLAREQYYFDKLKPQYNILKIAGSSQGHKLSEETKIKINKALKGIYVGENSSLFGRSHTETTKELMSLRKAGKNNPL